jgi:hypothetical protein
MPTLLRRIRGTIAMAFWWAIAWAPFGAAIALGEWVRFVLKYDIRLAHPWRVAARTALEFGAWGAIGGVCFALALMAAARVRGPKPGRMSAWRATCSGAIVALAVPLTYKVALVLGLLPVPNVGVGAILSALPTSAAILLGAFATLGGAVAAGILATARRHTQPAVGASSPALISDGIAR